MAKNNLMICSNAKAGLKKLNESEGHGKKYILEGIFAELDVLNRNQRIYPKDEYLRHLQYLRDDIRKGEPLLGELDHPEDRFEVKLKEASHRVIDLWYDSRTNKVMGRIELLNTPNGLLAQSLVDQGIPLHISSRAAGSVNSDNTVSIQQIYTYDLVCKPGFAGAVLHTVNESVSKYTKEAIQFLNNSLASENLNSAQRYGFVNESLSINEMTATAVLRKEAKALQINKETEINIKDMNKPLMEDAFSAAFQAPGNTVPNKANEEDNTEEKDTGGEDKEKNSEESSDDNGVEILDVRAEYASGSDKESGEGEGEENEEGNDEENSDKEEGNDEDTTSESSDGKESKMLCDKEEISKEGKSISQRLEDVRKIIKDLGETAKKNKEGESGEKNECGSGCCSSKNEAVLSQYPVSRMLTESNYAKFMALNEQQKAKVVAYLQDNRMFDPMTINEHWTNGLEYSGREPVWLSRAPREYRAVYESSNKKTKDSIAYNASFMIFESQRDIDNFWENCGIMRVYENKRLNESFIANMPKIVREEPKGLGYSMKFIEQITDLACEYNK